MSTEAVGIAGALRRSESEPIRRPYMPHASRQGNKRDQLPRTETAEAAGWSMHSRGMNRNPNVIVIFDEW